MSATPQQVEHYERLADLAESLQAKAERIQVALRGLTSIRQAINARIDERRALGLADSHHVHDERVHTCGLQGRMRGAVLITKTGQLVRP